MKMYNHLPSCCYQEVHHRERQADIHTQYCGSWKWLPSFPLLHWSFTRSRETGLWLWRGKKGGACSNSLILACRFPPTDLLSKQNGRYAQGTSGQLPPTRHHEYPSIFSCYPRTCISNPTRLPPSGDFNYSFFFFFENQYSHSCYGIWRGLQLLHRLSLVGTSRSIEPTASSPKDRSPRLSNVRFRFDFLHRLWRPGWGIDSNNRQEMQYFGPKCEQNVTLFQGYWCTFSQTLEV